MYRPNKIYSIILLGLCVAMGLTCKQRYTPPVLTIDKNYLVVDGFIVPGNDSTILLLSRTIKISDTLTPRPEIGANVSVVGENNDIHPLNADGDGRYVSAGLNLNPGQKYRLQIATTNGQQYLSDFVEVKQSPAIDSLNWDTDSTGNVQVYANTHDDARNATYYKWDYVETWQYHSSDNSYFDWVNHHEVFREPEDHVYYCWHTFNSTNVNTFSTARLEQDIVFRRPIVSVIKASERISIRYSVFVKQCVLTQQAYNFWQAVKQTTEQLGGLFDAQPSQLQSNIHCVGDTSQLVVGYASISSRQTKRLFIALADVPGWGHIPYYDGLGCEGYKVVRPDEIEGYFPPGGPYFYTYIGTATGGAGYVLQKIFCADCREKGGTNVKPSFWP